MPYTRRDLGKMVLAIPAVWLCRSTAPLAATRATKPHSKWAGVQVGLNVPYSFGTRTGMSAEDVLAQCLLAGISGVELRAQAIEISLGLPADLILGPAPSDYEAVRTPVGQMPGVWRAPATMSDGRAGRGMTAAEEAKYKTKSNQLNKWRVSAASLGKAKELRRKYEDAGVLVEVVKFDGINDMPNAALDYGFSLAKAMGSRAISGELSMPAAKRLAQAADRNKMLVGLHGHMAVGDAIWEQTFANGKYSGANVDIGHYVAGNFGSPVAFIKKHHDRITHLHVKDRKINEGPNVDFGKGDTPIREVLRLLRDNKWPIQATIEYEIPLPPGADRMAEIRNAIDYCRQCLLT